MKKYIRKADIILFLVLTATGIAVSAALAMSHADAGSGSKVVIKSGGKLFATYSLITDTAITVPVPGKKSAGPDESDTRQSSYNIVEIKDGSVSVTEASCKNQVCVKHGAISRPGESIVCLPNRLVVTIEGSGKGDEYDSVTS